MGGRTFIGVAIAILVLSAVYAIAPRIRPTEADANTVVGDVANCRDASMVSRLPGLPEASGLAASKTNADLFWSHNDSADAVLIGIARDGAIKSQVRVTGAAVDDWEAVTTAPCPQGSCLYIADIGDNQARRQRITIYRAVEPAATATATAPVEAFALVYPEGPQDAEALFATTDGTLYVVTKGEGAPVHVYRVPALETTAPLRLTRIATLTGSEAGKTSRVTDAAASPDGKWVVLRTNDRLVFYKTADLTAGQPGVPLEFDLRPLKESQGEGIAWSADGTLYLAGEAGGGGTFARVSCTLPSS